MTTKEDMMWYDSNLKTIKKMVQSMASSGLTKSERLERYSDFLEFQNKFANQLEDFAQSSKISIDKICPKAYVVKRYVSNIGDVYIVQYLEDNGSIKIESAVSRDRVLFYDYTNINQGLADKLCDIMQQVPEPGDVFDKKYFTYYEKTVKIQNYPFGEDDNAPQLGCCGTGCCGPNRKYIRYTMREKEDGNVEHPLYLYFEGDSH